MRIPVAKSSDVDMENDECGGEFVTDYIQKWVKKNAKNGAFKRQSATSAEIYFSEVRIPLYDLEGQGLGIDEWIKPLRRDLMKNCKYKVADRSVGLGDGRLVITK